MSKKQPARRVTLQSHSECAITFPHGMTLESLRVDVTRLQSFSEALRLSLLAAANQQTLGLEHRAPADVTALSDVAQEVNDLIWKTIGELSGGIVPIDTAQSGGAR